MTSVQPLIYPVPRAAGDWIPVGSFSELFDDENCCGITVDGLKIGLFLVEGQLFALDDICTHGNARLSDGDLEGYEIECPLHAGAFDLRNGKALCSPLSKDTRCHSVKVDDDQIYIQLNA
ncbi:non-heme iron oxygenase ferredoxin subunit [Pseudomonas sp. BN515]|uniref:non-heme iron oxygenase ferredoxin subunit n=1 Tax=Pseudomonas sp. BN515 TaxID=2567892 RepID=UPI002457D018|nr:non-heme iron oxygenase ferredoxin subunit [Pseudomonas sp. BN515]MDH4872013.1 non-heme iron oxygenase ferredoxin subunit [Pseudomonas sp. BN515]